MGKNFFKKIIRTISYRDRYSSTNEDFKKLGFLKLEDINVYFSQIFVYKSLNKLVQVCTKVVSNTVITAILTKLDFFALIYFSTVAATSDQWCIILLLFEFNINHFEINIAFN